MRWPRKINAGALQFVLFMGTVIALLLMGFLLVSHTHNHFFKQTDQMVAVIRASEAGIINYLNRSPLSENGAPKPSFAFEGTEVSVVSDYWGVFRKVSSTARKGKQWFRKSALIGVAKDTLNALYLEDHQRPMVIAGDALIRGTAYLPERGIKMGNIRGQGYFREQLIYGTQRKSTSDMPQLQPALENYLKQLTHSADDPSTEELQLSGNSNLQNSFFNGLKMLKEETIILEHTRITGHIMIWAGRKIVVEPSATLKDVILVAPEIIILDGVEGYFQAIASEKLSVGKHCSLAYPSALLIYPTEKKVESNNVEEPDLFIDENSSVKGIVGYYSVENEGQYAPQLSIAPTTVVEGEVYCSNNLELKGTVLGTVYTSGFIAMEQGSVYMNHLFKGKIDNPGLAEAYAGWELQDNSRSNKIVKWLY